MIPDWTCPQRVRCIRRVRRKSRRSRADHENDARIGVQHRRTDFAHLLVCLHEAHIEYDMMLKTRFGRSHYG